jgi:tRNA nucleotidyltransferase/poly(A) polymerase
MMEEMVIKEAAKLPQVAEGLKLARAINGLGYEAYLVGGCVRDLVRWKLGLDADPDIHDVDLATNMPAEELAKHFKTASNNGEKHGTILVFMDDIPFEVTRFRADGEYSDGRHPDSIDFADTFEEDTKRRDFTMNAMGMDADCRIVDYHGGVGSIRSGVLSTVGNPVDRFNEDALRILRAGRFSSKFGMKPDLVMLSACRALSPRLKFLSMERVHDELTKCASPKAFAGMLHFLDDGLGKVLSESIDWKGAARAVDSWISYHQKPWDTITGMAILFMSCSGDVELEMRKFKCTVDEIDAYKFSHAMYMAYHSGKLDLVDLVDLVNNKKWPAFAGVVNAYDGKCAIDAVQEDKLKRLGNTYPTQKDITTAMKEAGIKQGPEFGQILRRVRLCSYKHKLDGRRSMDAPYLDKLVAEIKREYI